MQFNGVKTTLTFNSIGHEEPKSHDTTDTRVSSRWHFLFWVNYTFNALFNNHLCKVSPSVASSKISAVCLRDPFPGRFGIDAFKSLKRNARECGPKQSLPPAKDACSESWTNGFLALRCNNWCAQNFCLSKTSWRATKWIACLSKSPARSIFPSFIFFFLLIT